MSSRNCLLALVGCLLMASCLVAHERFIRIEVYPKDKEQYLEFVQSDLDLGCIHMDHLDVLVSLDELDEIKASGAEFKVINPNVYRNARGGSWLPEYLSFSEMETQINDLASNYPNITQLVSIGTSIEGRTIHALKISDNPTVDEDEAEILIIGNHHAREVITPIICMHVATELCEGYGSDATFTDWVDNREIWVVPVLNPDGYVYVETTNLFWRKNRRDNPGDDEGVDLNRNWGFEWGHDNNGSSPNYRSSTYRGAAPFSEPEVDALRHFINGREFTVAMTFHSFGNLLLWGPGYKAGDGADRDILQGMGNVVTAQNGYTIGNPATGAIYITNGDATDWMYHEAGIFAFTPEVGTGSDYFNPPAERIPVLVEQGEICAWEAIRYGARMGQLAPPGQATFNEVTTNTPDFTLSWNAPTEADTEVVNYQLVEKTNPVVSTDDVEGGITELDSGGWVVSSQRAASGNSSYFSGASNRLNNISFFKESYVVQPGDSFTFDAWFDIEDGWDYAYVIVSTNGGRSYEELQGTLTTMDDPHGRNADHGLTGNSDGWQAMSFDLSDYEGQSVWLGFRYSTDGNALGDGMWVDNISPVQTWGNSTSLAGDISTTEFAISNRTPGTYYYCLRGLDAEGEWGYPSAMTSVTVDSEFTIAPTVYNVTRGNQTSGNLTSIQESDNDDVGIVRRGADIQPRTELEVESTSPVSDPAAITVTLEGAVFARTLVNQSIELYNFDSDAWEVVDTRPASRFVDASVSVQASGDLSRFVEVGTRAIRARAVYLSAVQRQRFSSNTDQLIWTIEID